METKKLKIAIPKKWYIYKEIINLFSEIWLKIKNNWRELFYCIWEQNIEFIFLRNKDIPNVVKSWICSIGIIGSDIIEEQWSKVDTIKQLWFGKCRFSIAFPNRNKISNLQEINNQKISTSYPNILKKFCINNKLNIDIVKISWSVEVMPLLKLSDGIADIISTWTTLLENWLKECFEIWKFETVVIQTKKDISLEQNEIIEKILFRIDAIIEAKKKKYIVMNAPEDKVKLISEILPWIDSPTITPLNKKWLVSFAAVMEENIFRDDIEKIKKLWASGLLIMPIEKIIL